MRERRKVDPLGWRFLLVRHIDKGKNSRRFWPTDRLQRPKRLAGGVMLITARHRHEHPRGMIAEGCCESDLFLRRRPRRPEIRSPKALHKAYGQLFDCCCAILVARLDYPGQRRPTERPDSQKTRSKRGTGFTYQRC